MYFMLLRSYSIESNLKLNKLQHLILYTMYTDFLAYLLIDFFLVSLPQIVRTPTMCQEKFQSYRNILVSSFYR